MGLAAGGDGSGRLPCFVVTYRADVSANGVTVTPGTSMTSSSGRAAVVFRVNIRPADKRVRRCLPRSAKSLISGGKTNREKVRTACDRRSLPLRRRERKLGSDGQVTGAVILHAFAVVIDVGTQKIAHLIVTEIAERRVLGNAL